MKPLLYSIPVGLLAVALTAQAATVSLSPSTKTLTVGDTLTADVLLDTQGTSIDGVDIQLSFNPANLQVQGSQITAGSLMPNTLTNSVDGTAGKIVFSQTTNGGTTFNGSGKLATVSFKTLNSVTAGVNFGFTLGKTTDSNVASGGADVLTAVTNGQYTINTVQGTPPSPVSDNPPLSSLPSTVTPATNASSTPGTPWYTAPNAPEAHPNQCVINKNGTFYLILGNQRKGITNLGILYTYGYDLTDAVPANTDDDLIPEGSLLLPDDGSLVKKPGDPTVYLTSAGQKHGFISSTVFTELGFSFKEVLTVTGPELDAMPQGDVIRDSSARHMQGVQIKDGAKIYWLDGTSRWAYESLDVYNSWNVNNKFSHVVVANNADRALPLGGVITKRSICGK